MSGTKTQPKQKTRPKKKKKAFVRLLIFLFIIGLTAVCGYTSYNYVMKNYVSAGDKSKIIIAPQDEVKFVIPKGSNTSTIANLLKEQELIKDVNIFKLLSKFNGYDGMYQSGTHVVSNSLSYDEIMRVLTTKPVSRQVTIPEGKSFTQIVDILYSKNIITDKEKFIKVANTETFEYDFLKDLPQRDNKLEGYLFPDTYEFDMNVSEKEIIVRMLDNFARKFKPEYAEKIKTIKGMTMDKIIILASIIEREAKAPEDRSIISGVFYNRMASKDKTLRKLQSCATIQYILLKKTGAVKERLLDADLKLEDPYNTYLHEGLPPGPICCPGEAAINAALYPEDTKYLYFVAKGDGSHQFSETYKQHQAAINKYGLR